MGASIRTTSGPAIARTGDLAAILTNLEEGDVLFIDEIHRLNRMVEEVLYPALEDFELDIVVGKGPAARSIRLDLPRFTLIGATTRTGLLTGPLRDRFGVAFRLQYYTPEELSLIVCRSASILNVAIDEEGALEIARRSRGTPRLANRLLKRVRDWAQVRGDGAITEDVAAEALTFFEVDHLGLDAVDNRLLEVLCVQFGGRPVGLTTLGVRIGGRPRYGGRRVRALPHAAGPHDAHSQGSSGHRRRLGAFGTHPAGRVLRSEYVRARLSDAHHRSASGGHSTLYGAGGRRGGSGRSRGALDMALGDATDLDGEALLSLAPESLASVLQVSGVDPHLTEYIARSLMLSGRYHGEAGRADVAELRRPRVAPSLPPSATSWEPTP